jgi:hypothetical protein
MYDALNPCFCALKCLCRQKSDQIIFFGPLSVTVPVQSNAKKRGRQTRGERRGSERGMYTGGYQHRLWLLEENKQGVKGDQIKYSGWEGGPALIFRVSLQDWCPSISLRPELRASGYQDGIRCTKIQASGADFKLDRPAVVHDVRSTSSWSYTNMRRTQIWSYTNMVVHKYVSYTNMYVPPLGRTQNPF